MMKITLIKLIYFIKRYLFLRKGKEYKKSQCYCVGDVDKGDNVLLSRYYDVVIVDNVDLLSWKKVLFEKIAFRKIKVNNLKTFFCKNAKTNYFEISRLMSVVDFVFSRQLKNCFVINDFHIADMFKVIFPNYDVFLVSNKLGWFLRKILVIFSIFSSNKDINSGLVVFLNVYDSDFLRAYRRFHFHKRIVLRFHDIIDVVFNGKDIGIVKKIINDLYRSKIVDRIESYHKDEANILGIKYVPNAINREILKIKSKPRYLLSFIGAYGSDNCSRKHYMDRLKDAVKNIYGTHEGYVYEYLVSGRYGNPRLSYQEYLKLVSDSEIMIDFFRLNPNEGLSFRTSEAILMDKKIITNRTSIKTYDFYDPDKGFILGEDNFEMLDDFIKRTVSLYPDEIKRKYDNSLWWNDL